MQQHTIRLFWRTAMKYRFRTFGAMIGSILAVLTSSFAAPFVISLILDQLQNGTFTLEGVVPLMWLFILCQLYGEVIGWRLTLYWVWTMEASGYRDLHRKMFTTLSEQSLTFHANRFGGALVSQTTKLTGAFERFWDTIIFQLTPSITSLVAAITIMSFIFWQYAIVLTVLSIIFITIILLGSKFLLKRNREESQATTAVNAFVADAVTNISTIKAHGHETAELEKLSDKTATFFSKSMANMRGFLFVSTGYSIMIAVLNISALSLSIWAADKQLIAIGTIYLAVTYTFTVARQLWEINNIMRNYNRVMGDAHDMTEILMLDPEVVDHSDKQLVVSKGAIELREVSFTHDGNSETLFHNFDLMIPSGQRVGLVGHSGSGKTTLTRLLLRFADIDAGAIMIDGQDIKQHTQKSLRRSIAYVPQEPMLFHRSLAENIAYGKPDATMEEIRKAAKQANALDFIKGLPQGFDTLVGERGVKLSGGQRQRIAIARAILKDAPILVLDEATSALDSESEKLIQDALEKLMKGRTSLVIAHRLSTIAKLDRILVLENGQVVEDDSHANLLKKKGVYAGLWNHQSGGFIEE